MSHKKLTLLKILNEDRNLFYTMNFTLLSIALFCALIAPTFSVFTQSTGVKGTLMCGDKPLANAKVKLYDDDTGPDLDDLLAEGTTDSLGQFLLQGHTSEVMTIDPKLNIYHDCDDGIKPCQRKVTFNIPKSFVSNGETPKQFFNIGQINMQIEFESESRDCVH
ncbi:unnamed protein product [Caenorhabditis angaria]|uniref:Uncharacterized protein n=1 Tax=Caenorhabditis angaria TaxID=860376 RepID=A0A9P1IW48_9PELO|nr:unnamed protein product [Caenorhabditis angaria]